MTYEAENIGHGMHGAIGGVAQAAMAAWMLSRQDAGRRDAEQAAAANGARAGVLRTTVHGLREQLAEERHQHREAILDAQADADFFRGENTKLTARIAQLEGAVRYLDAERKARAA